MRLVPLLLLIVLCLACSNEEQAFTPIPTSTPEPTATPRPFGQDSLVCTSLGGTMDGTVGMTSERKAEILVRTYGYLQGPREDADEALAHIKEVCGTTWGATNP